MQKLISYFDGHYFGHHVPMETALIKGRIQKIVISSKSGLMPGCYDGIIVEHSKPSSMKDHAKNEADAYTAKYGSVVGIRTKKGKRKSYCLHTVAYAIAK